MEAPTAMAVERRRPSADRSDHTRPLATMPLRYSGPRSQQLIHHQLHIGGLREPAPVNAHAAQREDTRTNEADQAGIVRSTHMHRIHAATLNLLFELTRPMAIRERMRTIAN